MKTKQIPPNRLRRFASEFCSVSSTANLCDLLEVEANSLWQYSNEPHYKPFYVSKKQGGFRYVEDPVDGLKKIQRSLNEYLQCVYHTIRTDAAYGFLMTAKEELQPRNIMTNAEQHINHGWMINIDFSDFFHAIKSESIYDTFMCEPFCFNERISKTLTKLTTFEGRLPMGAPTSPVLSNFETRLLDYDLLAFAKNNGLTYTRFADDLTFSSNSGIDDGVLGKIQSVSELYGFSLNPAKTKFYTPSDTKYVTGLKVTDHVELPDEYYRKIVAEIEKYKHIMEIQYRNGYRKTPWVLKYQQQIKGTIEFAGFVLGKKTLEYEALVDAYDRATFPMAEVFESVSWLDFNYN